MVSGKNRSVTIFTLGFRTAAVSRPVARYDAILKLTVLKVNTLFCGILGRLTGNGVKSEIPRETSGSVHNVSDSCEFTVTFPKRPIPRDSVNSRDEVLTDRRDSDTEDMYTLAVIGIGSVVDDDGCRLLPASFCGSGARTVLLDGSSSSSSSRHEKPPNMSKEGVNQPNERHPLWLRSMNLETVLRVV